MPRALAHLSLLSSQSSQARLDRGVLHINVDKKEGTAAVPAKVRIPVEAPGAGPLFRMR